MIGRRSVIGIVMALALAFAAFASASASGAQRAEACVSGGGTAFTDAHCKVSGAGTFGLKNITNGVETAITGTNAKTASETSAASAAVLAGNLAGVATELTCTTVSGSGSLTNAEASVSGTGKITYSGCTVVKPAGKECKVNKGTVNTEELAATTVGQAENKLKFEQIGTKFANVIIEGCTVGSLNNTFPVTGSLVADTSGATTSSTEAGITAQGTLKFGGNKAGLEGAITISNSEGGLVLK
jgi:hypothetical protein